jgi:hypothetical protein
MTIVATTLIHPLPGAAWADVQKQIHKACELVSKHGAENVTALVNMIGGQATNTLGILMTAENWAKFGQVQQAFLDDPETQTLMLESGQIATWENYVAQTIEV